MKLTNLTNKQYDFIKQLVTVVAPAAITLISALGAIYHFDPTAINGTIAAVVTFFGALIGISSNNYNRKNEE